jgi:hypothetical protein
MNGYLLSLECTYYQWYSRPLVQVQFHDWWVVPFSLFVACCDEPHFAPLREIALTADSES